jgi:hypothetical protein
MPFIIKSVSNGLVLDVRNGDKRNGAEVILWPYNGGSNQQWEYKNNMIYSKLGKYVFSRFSVDNTSQNIAHIAIPRPALMYASY